MKENKQNQNQYKLSQETRNIVHTLMQQINFINYFP